jgi:hypothetical protein
MACDMFAEILRYYLTESDGALPHRKICALKLKPTSLLLLFHQVRGEAPCSTIEVIAGGLM